MGPFINMPVVRPSVNVMKSVAKLCDTFNNLVWNLELNKLRLVLSLLHALFLSSDFSFGV